MMERSYQRILHLYRKHLLNRLDYAYSAGDLGEDDYQRLWRRVTGTGRLPELWTVVRDVRVTQARGRGRYRDQRPRTVLTREERRIRSLNRRWKPERYWPAAIAVAIVIGLIVLFVMFATTTWVESLGNMIGW